MDKDDIVYIMKYYSAMRKKKILQFEITSVGGDVEEGEPLCTVNGNVNWCSQLENTAEFPQKVKNKSII